ncbi:MAG: FAD-binding oxidoreductase [Ilumatobacteraceae bacterium]
MAVGQRRARLAGWGRTAAAVATVDEVSVTGAARAVAGAGPRGALVRGLGRSYGDAAQNSGGLVLRLPAATGDVLLDASAGTVVVPAGLSLGELLHLVLPHGFFVSVLPGTMHVTVGGAIASDIHGKNHHRDGSFGSSVESLRLLLADGSVASVGPSSRSDDAALFWATVGGMGLTGIVVDATLRLLPVETSRMSVDTTRIPDLDTLMAAMADSDHRYRYSVAWIDLVAKGAHLGRSILTNGDHATLDQLPGRAAGAPLAFEPRQLVTVPPVIPPGGLLNHLSVAAFNELWYRKSPRHKVGQLQPIGFYFCPLDLVGAWNRFYGRSGLLQYQFVVPFGAETTMRAVIERLVASGTASFLAVLKRFGPSNPAPLSFPTEGWTLALDVPAGARSGLGEMLHELDRLVLDAGGRHYLAKDSHATPDVVRQGYPRLDEWRAVRRRADPHGRWQSDLARRLGLLSNG